MSAVLFHSQGQENMPGQQITNGFDGPLQTIFQAFMADWVLVPEKSAQEVMDTYFTSDFFADIDGHHLSRAQFQRRIDRMRKDAAVETQEFVEMMETDDRLFSMHTTHGQSLASGYPFETRAIALFVFEGGKIKRGYLNSATLGDPSDADFASRS